MGVLWVQPGCRLLLRLPSRRSPPTTLPAKPPGILEEPEFMQSHIGVKAAAEARMAESATTRAVTEGVADGIALDISRRRIVTLTILSS